MAVSGEVKEVIEKTVEAAFEKFEETQALILRVHAAECPGRGVGKGLVLLLTGAGTGAVFGLKALWAWLQSQGKL